MIMKWEGNLFLVGFRVDSRLIRFPLRRKKLCDPFCAICSFCCNAARRGGAIIQVGTEITICLSSDYKNILKLNLLSKFSFSTYFLFIVLLAR